MPNRPTGQSLEFLDAELQAFVDLYSARLVTPLDRLKYVRRCAARAELYPPIVRKTPFWPLIARGLAFDCLMRLRRDFDARLGWGLRSFLAAFRAGQATLDFCYPKRWALAAASVPLILIGASANLGDWMTPRTVEAIPSGPAIVEQPIWHVENEGDADLYSNGLTIYNQFRTATESKPLPVLRGGRGIELLRDLDRLEWRDGPIGIVYHTTVSDVLPTFLEENNATIRQKGRALLNYISREKLYNFVIDRFGRAFRVVPEAQTAFHAGFSMWGRGAERYLDLNEGFIGVAFETRPEAVELDAGPELTVTAAQIATARLLTQVLREEYNIPTENCITHEMVAVNHSDMLIGRHTDWAGRFPFDQVGLPNNYELPMPSVADWGFQHDDDFVAVVGEPWPGVAEGERLFAVEAASRGMSVSEFRRQRAAVYAKLRRALKEQRRAAEPTD